MDPGALPREHNATAVRRVRAHARRRGLPAEETADCSAAFVAHCLLCRSGQAARRAGGGCPPPLLDTCAAHFVVDAARCLARRRCHEAPLGAAKNAAAECAATPEAEAMRDAFWDVALSALTGLAPRARSIVVAHVVHGTRIAEIAAREGSSEAAVRKALARGLARLRAWLEADGHDRSDLAEFLAARPIE